MSWLVPWALVAGVVAATGVLAAHLLSRHRPPEVPLPTARFVREGVPSAATRMAPPSDRLLLLTRALALLLAALAVARPLREPARGTVRRVVALDRSHDVADGRAAADSARRLLRPGDRLVTFDGAARPIPAGAEAAALDSLPASRTAGSLSAALATAARTGALLARDADSVELVLVTPGLARQADAATDSVRAAWPGRLRVVRVAGKEARPSVSVVALRARADDPLRTTLALAGLLASGAAEPTVRVVRDAPTGADTAWVAGDSTRTLVHWPASQAGAGWPPSAPDTIGVAVAMRDRSVVAASFARSWRPPAGGVVARWADGAPAATESALGEGCVRGVAVPVEPAGDVALRLSMRDFARAMVAPCAANGPAVGDTSAALLGAATGPLASRRTLLAASGAPPPPSRLPALMLAAALALLLLELPLRRRAATAA